MTIPLARFLPEFKPTVFEPRRAPAAPAAADPDAPEPFGLDFEADDGFEPLAAGSAPDGDEIEARLAEARREGFADGEAAAQDALVTRLGEMKDAQARQIELLRQSWTAELAETVAAQLRDGLAELENRTAAILAELLEPIVTLSVRQKAIAEARDAIITLINGGPEAVIRISGPADLIAALQGTLGDRAVLDFSETDAPEVTIVAGDTTIRSHLQSWAAGLADALRSDP